MISKENIPPPPPPSTSFHSTSSSPRAAMSGAEEAESPSRSPSPESAVEVLHNPVSHRPPPPSRSSTCSDTASSAGSISLNAVPGAQIADDAENGEDDSQTLRSDASQDDDRDVDEPSTADHAAAVAHSPATDDAADVAEEDIEMIDEIAFAAALTSRDGDLSADEDSAGAERRRRKRPCIDADECMAYEVISDDSDDETHGQQASPPPLVGSVYALKDDAVDFFLVDEVSPAGSTTLAQANDVVGRYIRSWRDVGQVKVWEQKCREVVMHDRPVRLLASKLDPEKRLQLVFTNIPKELDPRTCAGSQNWEFRSQWYRCRWIIQHAGPKAPDVPRETFPADRTLKGVEARLLYPEEVPFQKPSISIRMRSLRWPASKLLDGYGSRPIDEIGVVDEAYRYTMGDVYCGVGGATRGAEMAGLKIEFGVDSNLEAINCWRANFGAATGLHGDICGREIMRQIEARPVDVLHASPPCQSFSRANRAPGGGRDADYNESAFFKVPEIVARCKPRIFTMEEVPGLTDVRNAECLTKLVRQLIRLGYSMRILEMDLGKHGVPQTRQRLILVAAAPGQRMPEELREYAHPATIAQYYDPTPEQLEQNPEYFTKQAPTVMASAKPEWPWGATMTWREIARLQTFDREFQFGSSESSRRKMIGNAVPPVFAAELYKSCIEALKATDAEIAAENNDPT